MYDMLKDSAKEGQKCEYTITTQNKCSIANKIDIARASRVNLSIPAVEVQDTIMR